MSHSCARTNGKKHVHNECAFSYPEFLRTLATFPSLALGAWQYATQGHLESEGKVGGAGVEELNENGKHTCGRCVALYGL